MADTTIANDIKSGVQEIMDEIGKSAHIRQITEGSFIDSNNPSQGKTQTTTDIAVSVLGDKFRNSEVDGEIIKQEDKKFLLSLEGISITPTIQDKLIEDLNGGDETIYDIVNIKPVEVSGIDTFMELQVRQ